MTRSLSVRVCGGAFFFGTLVAASFAAAETVSDFYRRTPITIDVASGPGGGFDVYARIFAAHFADHIPGHPSIIVKNMPGATGLVAMNYLSNSAPRDGSVIVASFNTVVLSPLYGDTNAKFDPRQMGWLGSIGKQTATCLTWYTSPVKTVDDARKQEVLLAATGEGSTPTTYPKLLNAMIGTKFKIITGYSTPGMRLAVENGEVQGICGVAWETHMASVPNWILDKKVNFLLQLGLSKSPHMPDVPMAIDMIKNPEDKQVFELLGIPQEFGRPIVAPPGVPADRLEALQEGFNETMKDQKYLDDADKAKQIVDPLSAQDMNALIARAYAMPKDIIARTAVYAVSTN